MTLDATQVVLFLTRSADRSGWTPERVPRGPKSSLFHPHLFHCEAHGSLSSARPSTRTTRQQHEPTGTDNSEKGVEGPLSTSLRAACPAGGSILRGIRAVTRAKQHHFQPGQRTARRHQNRVHGGEMEQREEARRAMLLQVQLVLASEHNHSRLPSSSTAERNGTRRTYYNQHHPAKG
ncbi:hypothetical protein K432DRAFT_196141 [Lepidopterella palustris CBS 459.81]|uniref:Uncharacterized protein n=1 Tax=Lepidopterella palustris CBS 459.81 TaxID=1314670 RepID=A0A8E2DZT5_9PEZI|nr:hypothetical protein K432DRAFT_196141 [Lepidopterella palustris CBS 459.81]